MRNPAGKEILHPLLCHRALSRGNMWKGLLAMLVLRKAIVKRPNKSLKFAAATRLGNHIVTFKTSRHVLGNLDMGTGLDPILINALRVQWLITCHEKKDF